MYLPLMSSFLYFLFGGLGPPLTVYLGLFAGGSQDIVYSAADQVWVDQVQGKYLNPCTLWPLYE